MENNSRDEHTHLKKSGEKPLRRFGTLIRESGWEMVIVERGDEVLKMLLDVLSQKGSTESVL